MDRSSKYGLAAALLLATGAVVELVGVGFDSSAPGFAEPHGHAISIGLAVLWTATALSVVIRHRAAWLATLAWVLSVASTLSVLAHAFMLRVGDAWYGGVYFVAAPVLAFLLWKTLGRPPERHRLRREARHEA